MSIDIIMLSQFNFHHRQVIIRQSRTEYTTNA